MNGLLRFDDLGKREGELSHLVIVPWFIPGGAEREIALLCEAVLELCPENSIGIVLTDKGTVDARSWLPEGVDLFDLSAELAGNNPAEKSELLANLLLKLRPRTVFCAGSIVGWYCFNLHGASLSRYMVLIGGVASFERDSSGHPIHPLIAMLPNVINYLSAIIADNRSSLEVLLGTTNLPEFQQKKFRAVYFPCSEAFTHTPRAPLSQGDRMRVLWASRLSNEKRIDLLLQIAEQTPWADFDVWGDNGDGVHLLAQCPANMRLMGKYSRFQDICPEKFHCFLYTSLRDGMPNVLIEAIANKLPIIAPALGGIPELLQDDSGYLVPQLCTVTDYQRALLQIKADPAAAALRAEIATQRVSARHSPEHFRSQLIEIPGLIK